MTKLIKQIGVCTLVLGLQLGMGLASVSAAPVSMNAQQIAQQEATDLAEKQQEIWRHEQAMLQQDNETSPDWQWRQWMEREHHIRNMQIIQSDEMNFAGAAPIWRVSSVHRP